MEAAQTLFFSGDFAKTFSLGLAANDEALPNLIQTSSKMEMGNPTYSSPPADS
jgi:hypothetical protein